MKNCGRRELWVRMGLSEKMGSYEQRTMGENGILGEAEN